MTAPRDPYDRAFSDSLDYVDKVGAKLGRWLNLGGLKFLMTTGTILAILFFGIWQFLHSFKVNLIKRHHN